MAPLPKAGPIPILGAQHTANRERATVNTDSLSQRIATSAQSMLLEGQILQKLADMKEQMEIVIGSKRLDR